MSLVQFGTRKNEPIHFTVKEEKKMKVLEQINNEFKNLSYRWAEGNSHGIPVTKTGKLELINLQRLEFKEDLDVTNPYISVVLRQIADILEEYF